MANRSQRTNDDQNIIVINYDWFTSNTAAAMLSPMSSGRKVADDFNHEATVKEKRVAPKSNFDSACGR
jgi:hypothetical protein